MSFQNLFSQWKNKHSALDNSSLDQKLVRDRQNYSWPRLSQLKYLPFFLNAKQKRQMIICSLLIIVSFFTAAGIFVSRHLAVAPKTGGAYSEGLIGQPKYLNPVFSDTNEIDADLVKLIYAGLFHHAKNGLEPYLAESYTISPDKKTYDIKLRPDLVFSDNEPFTVNDVIYTFELIQNPEVGSPLYAAFQEVQIEKTGEQSLRFTLKEPFAPFLNALTVGILPEHVWGDINIANLKLAKYNTQPIGAGPWKFSQLIKGDNGKINSYLLKPNPYFYGQKPYLQNLTLKFFEDYNSAVDALRGQEITALGFIPRLPKTKTLGRNFNTYPLYLPQYTALFFNPVSEPELQNADLRLALSQAIDKKLIIQQALDRAGEEINSPFLKGSLGYYPELKKTDYNLAGANNSLDKKWTRVQPEEYFKLRHDLMYKNYEKELQELKKNASSTPEQYRVRQQEIERQISDGIRANMDPNQTFYRKNKDNKILELTIATADTTEYDAVANLISAMWRQLGVKTAVKKISSHQIAKDLLKNREYQILLYGEINGADPDPFAFWHSSQTNYPGLNLALYANRAADKIMEDARLSADPAKRAELYKKFQDLIAQDRPAIFLYTPAHTFIADRSIKGISFNYLNSPADRFNNLSDWYIKTKWQWR